MVPTYSIDWASSKQGYLGNTINLVTTLISAIREGTIYKDQVSFQVTNANGLTSTATISLAIMPANNLHYISK